LLVVDATAPEADDPFALWPEFLEQRPDPAKVTLIRNKADLTGEDIRLEVSADGHVTISLSARSTDAGDGLELLRDHLKACMGYEQTSESSFSARRRHLEALRHASDALEHGRAQLTLAGPGNYLRKICARLSIRSVRLPGHSARMTCWGGFSPVSASANSPDSCRNELAHEQLRARSYSFRYSFTHHIPTEVLVQCVIDAAAILAASSYSPHSRGSSGHLWSAYDSRYLCDA
jgi:Predicted GTPase